MTSVSETLIQNNLIMNSTMAPVQNRLDCSEPDCTKTFVNIRNMTKHKDKFHMMVNAVSKSPIVSTVRTLFTEESSKDTVSASTQGTSNGSVNSPKVMSLGFFQCNDCTYQFTVKEELQKHKIENHEKTAAQKVHSSLVFEETEEIDLVESLEVTEVCLAANIVEKNLASKKVELLVKYSKILNYMTQ